MPFEGTALVLPIGFFIALVGIVQCYFGYKIFRVWCLIVGFLVGLIIDFILFYYVFYDLPDMTVIFVIIAVILPFLGAWLAFKLYRLGVFFHFFLATSIIVFIVSFIFSQSAETSLTIALIIGVIMGIVGMFLAKLMIMISSAFAGGLMIGSGISAIMQTDSNVIPLIISLVCIVTGFIVQWNMDKKAKAAEQSTGINAAEPVIPHNSDT